MKAVEKDRLYEILLYYYFRGLSAKYLGSQFFWNMVGEICKLHKLDAHAIAKAGRIVMSNDNIPTDEEAYYLLNKLGLSVREINNMTGIYWQKQREIAALFEHSGEPDIQRRITEFPIKDAIRGYIHALYELFGIFQYINSKEINQL